MAFRWGYHPHLIASRIFPSWGNGKSWKVANGLGNTKVVAVGIENYPLAPTVLGLSMSLPNHLRHRLPSHTPPGWNASSHTRFCRHSFLWRIQCRRISSAWIDDTDTSGIFWRNQQWMRTKNGTHLYSINSGVFIYNYFVANTLFVPCVSSCGGVERKMQSGVHSEYHSPICSETHKAIISRNYQHLF